MFSSNYKVLLGTTETGVRISTKMIQPFYYSVGSSIFASHNRVSDYDLIVINSACWTLIIFEKYCSKCSILQIIIQIFFFNDASQATQMFKTIVQCNCLHFKTKWYEIIAHLINAGSNHLNRTCYCLVGYKI